MWFIIIVSIIMLALVVIFFMLRRAGGGNFPWIQFYLKGKESGFAFKEVNLLRKIAVDLRMKEPTSLFWSIKQLDRSIKGIIMKFRSLGQEDDDKSIMMISKLFEFRKKVEFNKPKYNLGLKSSKEVMNRQRIKISLPNFPPFDSIVVDNLHRYMAIAYPHGAKLPAGFSWKNQQVGVSFWREGDAGYYFQTKVIDDYLDRKYPILHISHRDNLIRVQMRKSVRAEANLSALLYPLRSIEESSDNDEISEGSGLRCVLLDISEDGAAVLVGGKAKIGLPIKLQFVLSDRTIIMRGMVKSITYDEKKNRSVLHVQARIPARRLKNIIQSYVYNIFNEQDEMLARKAIIKQKNPDNPVNLSSKNPPDITEKIYPAGQPAPSMNSTNSSDR
jgi:c-di-GMP-binding flagellar brake protein YcgR